jgi:hypothetical protein
MGCNIAVRERTSETIESPRLGWARIWARARSNDAYRTLVVAVPHVRVSKEKIHVCLLDMSVVIFAAWWSVCTRLNYIAD